MPSRTRPVAGLVSALLLLGGVGMRSEPTSPARATSSLPIVHYGAPVSGPLQVLTPFDPPATPYGPGHLGVDLAAAQGTAVRSAGVGTVVFAGRVAGRGVVVIGHPDGIRTEYEPLHIAVQHGAGVVAGTLLGRVDGSHGACAPASCLHWGARRDTTYLNPLDLLRSLGPVRLLPWAGGTG